MKKSFTLVEMIIVIGIISLIIPTIFVLIFTIINQQTKVYRLSIVKTDGDYILNAISDTIRNNAISIHSATPPSNNNIICDNVQTVDLLTAIYFLDKNNQWFGYSFNNGNISSSSATTTINLNSVKTLINNFNIGCSRNNPYSYSLVNVSFDICYKTGANTCSSARANETVTLHYQSTINLKNL
ncbi:MAG: hypothetical protein ACPLRN_03145 [Microgenomates group bacterium]